MEEKQGGLNVAARSVKGNPKAYISFILALFLIQALLCLLLSAATLDVRHTSREIGEQYDYDIMLRGLSQAQYAELHNIEMEIPDEMIGTEWFPYSDFRYEKVAPDNYNVYIALLGENIKKEAADMAAMFFSQIAAEDQVNISYSPRYNYHAYLGNLYAQAIISIGLLLALAVFLLVMLQRTRLHHEKYQYGIYMTFGATYRRLYGTVSGEMFYIILMTTVPALILGNLGSILLCIGTGKSWGPSWQAIVLPPLLTLALTWISVHFPVKDMANKPPVELLSARDNSNLVTSPRRSLHVFGRSFPFTYELFSLWRYRRYLAGLLLSTMLFASLWLGLMRIADFNTAKSQTAAPEYTVNFDAEESSTDLLNTSAELLAYDIEQLPGVDRCGYSVSLNVMELRGFMAVSGRAARRAGSYIANSRNVTGAEYPYATNAYRYVAYNEDTLDRLVAQSEKIDGDVYAVLENDHNVILSTALNNTTRFAFEVGDTVLLATNKMTAFTQVMTTNNIDLLRMMLNDEEFYLEEYTVCAVIRDEKSDHLLTCGVNHDAYQNLTGMEAYPTAVQVYLKQDTDFATLKEIDESVQLIASDYLGTRITAHNYQFSYYLGSFRNLSARLITAAYFLLIMMPLFSFFSQRVFYRKREREWFIIKTLGGQRRERSRLLLVSGAILTAANFVVMLPLGLLVDYLAFKMCNEWLPAGGFVTSALMYYRISPLVIPIILFFALLCGFAPCAIEYYHVRRAMQKEDEMEGLLAAERAAYQSNDQEDTANVSEKE